MEQPSAPQLGAPIQPIAALPEWRSRSVWTGSITGGDRRAVSRRRCHRARGHLRDDAAERLAIIDRDVDRLVELLGGDLSSPHQFQRVAEAMVELGDADDALRWARRGIAETSGWQVAKLYDLAAELLTDSNETDEVVEVRRHHHERTPSASTYTKLQTAAGNVASWGAEADRARAVLAERDPAGYIDAPLADGEADEAWAVALTRAREIQASRWRPLAEAREPTAPGDAMAVYRRFAFQRGVTVASRCQFGLPA